jgi:hypothetical protein
MALASKARSRARPMPQADAGPAQQRDPTRSGDLVFGVTAVPGRPIDPGRHQQAALVVQAEGLDREAGNRGELDGSQFLHDAIIKRTPGARSSHQPGGRPSAWS